MITKKKPEGKTLSPKSLFDILCGDEDKSVNIIENIIQRELVWSLPCIETFWHDVLECIRINIANTKSGLRGKVFDKAYMNAGNIEYSTIDATNKDAVKPLDVGEHKSIVDGSQRNRISLFMVLAYMFEKCKINDKEYVDLSYFKSDNGEYKLMEIGIGKLDSFFHKIETTTIAELSKEINKRSLDKRTKKFQKNDEERDYFEVFALYAQYIERDIIGTYDIEDAFYISLNNIYFYEEKIDEESKFDRFVDRNKKGTPMSDESMYPKYIINQFGAEKEKVYKAFKRFEAKASEAQIKPKQTGGKFRTTKSGVGAILYIMIENLKISLAKEAKRGKNVDLKNVFSSTFDLANIDYGVEKCFRKGLVFNTPDDAVNYFNQCYDLAEFLIKDSFSRHENIYEDCYYLRDFGTPDVLWWYFIKPSYIAQKEFSSNDERFKFIKKMLYRVYSFYVVHRGSGDTNSQNLINLLERISSLMITSSEELDDFEKKIRSDVSSYISNAGGYMALHSTIFGLSYAHKSKSAIEQIFIAMEYDLCERFGLDTGVLHSLFKRKDGKSFNLDHWYPENEFKDKENWVEYQQIGNLVILEDSLNKSKQDKKEVNSKYYTQSKYIQTLLMDKENRGTFNNKTIDFINNYPYFLRLDEYDTNNPTIELIRERTTKYAKFFVEFIRNFVENE